MTKDGLRALLDSWENLELIINEGRNDSDIFSALMDIAIHGKDPKSWRAAWVADKIHESRPESILPYLESITNQLKIETGSSKKRHFLKFISMHEIPPDDHSFLMDYCMNCLMSSTEPVSVRVYAMQILYNITEYEPDLKPELLSIIEHEMELDPSAGIKARGKKLIKNLKKELTRSGSHSF